MITKEAVTEQLKQVVDPELHINIVDLGLVYDIAINQEEKSVLVTMTLTTPGCPLSFVFEEWIPAAVKKIDEVKAVRIHLVWDPPWDPDKMSEDTRELLGFY